jgi:hypothetical protein
MLARHPIRSPDEATPRLRRSLAALRSRDVHASHWLVANYAISLDEDDAHDWDWDGTKWSSEQS